MIETKELFKRTITSPTPSPITKVFTLDDVVRNMTILQNKQNSIDQKYQLQSREIKTQMDDLKADLQVIIDAKKKADEDAKKDVTPDVTPGN